MDRSLVLAAASLALLIVGATAPWTGAAVPRVASANVYTIAVSGGS
jgi:hypothetical protein